MAGHTVTKAYKDVASIVVESDSNATDQKPQPLSKSFVEPQSDTRIEIERALAVLVVLTKTKIQSKITRPNGPTIFSRRTLELSSSHSRTP